MTLLCLSFVHAYLLLLGLFDVAAWPLLVAGLVSLVAAGGWAFPPVSKEAWSAAARVRGWSASTKRWTWVGIQAFAAAISLSAMTLLM
jgi:hypothetical protein